MKIPVKPKVLAPEGTYVARLISIIDIGSHKTSFGDKRQVLLTWELPTELHTFKEEEGQNHFLFQRDMVFLYTKNQSYVQ